MQSDPIRESFGLSHGPHLRPPAPRRAQNKMKVTEIAAALRRAVTDMQAFAVNNDDLELPNELVLAFIINFLTDKRLRELSAHGQSDAFQE